MCLHALGVRTPVAGRGYADRGAGFAGSYPNFFFDVAIDELEAFVSQVLVLGDAADALRLAERWGIRRTNPDFWVYADFMNRFHRNNDPVTAGLFDLSRYENR